MNPLRQQWRRLRGALRRTPSDEDFASELRFHLDQARRNFAGEATPDETPDGQRVFALVVSSQRWRRYEPSAAWPGPWTSGTMSVTGPVGCKR